MTLKRFEHGELVMKDGHDGWEDSAKVSSLGSSMSKDSTRAS